MAVSVVNLEALARAGLVGKEEVRASSSVREVSAANSVTISNAIVPGHEVLQDGRNHERPKVRRC